MTFNGSLPIVRNDKKDRVYTAINFERSGHFVAPKKITPRGTFFKILPILFYERNSVLYLFNFSISSAAKFCIVADKIG